MFKTKFLNWEIIASSVTGPSHLRENIPNQDYYQIAQLQNTLVAVVSDGLGGHKDSKKGAIAACQAVIDTVQHWDYCIESIDAMCKNIQARWLELIKPLSANSCGATCLFVILINDNEVICGRLGDGMVMIYNNNEVHILNPEDIIFSNITDVLSEDPSLLKWQWKHYKGLPEGSCISLMTDGISEDLNPNKLDQLPDILKSFINDTETKSNSLKNELKNWKTPNHTDDKTIVIMVKQ